MAVSIRVGNIRVGIIRVGFGSTAQRVLPHQGGGFCLVRPTAACTGDAAAATWTPQRREVHLIAQQSARHAQESARVDVTEVVVVVHQARHLWRQREAAIVRA
jgi:hypothetical protein